MGVSFIRDEKSGCGFLKRRYERSGCAVLSMEIRGWYGAVMSVTCCLTSCRVMTPLYFTTSHRSDLGAGRQQRRADWGVP